MGQKARDKAVSKVLSDNCIDMKRFLTMFNLCDYSVLNLKISHKDIKELIPGLKRMGFDELGKRIESIYTGDVIAVKDSYGRIVPYINPNLLNVELYGIVHGEREKCNIEVKKVIKEKSLKIYQLKKIGKLLAQHGRYKAYKTIKREVRKRVYSDLEKAKVKRYKREKRMLKEVLDYYEY